MQDDKAIIEEVLQGNKEAYAHIIDKYHEKIVFIIRKKLGNPQNVQDIAQEIFIKAYYHLPEYKANFEFGGWLYRIAANHCLDVIRKWKRTPTITGEDYQLIDTCTPETAYLEKEQRSFIRQQLMAIEEKYRIVLELRYLRFLSYEEISQRLSVPVTTVRARLSRGKKQAARGCRKNQEKGGLSLMRCLSKEQLDTYLFHHLSMSEHKKIDAHISACPKCTERLSKYVKGQDQAGGFVMEESETNQVTRKIIEKLRPYPLSVLHQGVDRTKLKQANWKKRSLDMMKKATVAVAGLALVVSLGTMVSPSFANYVNGLYKANAPVAVPAPNSLFTTFENADAGILHAVKNGFVQKVGLSVTDQGIKI